MNASDLMLAAVSYIQACGPFVLVFLVIACAGELIGLLRWAAGLYRRQTDREW